MSENITLLIEEVEKLKARVAEQTAHVERCVGDDMVEERAELRNMVMRLEGLKILLRKYEDKYAEWTLHE